MFNVFISYRREGGFDLARNLYDRLKAMGFQPFLDLEELRAGQFNERLYTTIAACKNFVLILSPGALDRCENEGDWLRNEILKALEVNCNIVPFFINGFTWPSKMPQGMESLPNYNGVTRSLEFYDATIERLANMLVGRQTKNGADEFVIHRVENLYYTMSQDHKELKRLRVQQELLKRFDQPCYQEIEQAYDALDVLDIGSNVGDFIMDRIGRSEKLHRLVGIEYDAETVDSANQKYGVEGKIKFYNGNAEDNSIVDVLEKILEEQGISSFNVINISMLLLHLKTPFRILKNIRKFLSADGVLVIKDIDDGLNLAYPDEHGDFARAMRICAQNEASGFRTSGRQIFTLLKNAGYTKIALKKTGLSTIGMDYDEREALFNVYFSFILDDAKIQTERYPENEKFLADYRWLKDVYDNLEERFMDDNFFFSLGFMIFCAKKKG